jgi:hypothetical protein
MPVNGPETNAELKSPQPVGGEGKSARAATDAKPTLTRGAATRRRRDRQDSTKANGEERFFLATVSRSGEVPMLGRECTTEAEAIIDAFREKVNFYRVTEYQTRADIDRSGEPILRKETLKKNNPAS